MLLLLSCSARKRHDTQPLPAILRYDGPLYQDLRAFLRRRGWPPALRIGTFSAEYGLIGALAPIPDYERRLDSERAAQLRSAVLATLARWRDLADRTVLVAGSLYVSSLLPALQSAGYSSVTVVPGAIGEKRAHLGRALQALPSVLQTRHDPVDMGRRTVFFPDWEDFLDPDFDFLTEHFSGPPGARRRVHAATALGEPISDGILVSLAQRLTHKGLLKQLDRSDPRSTAPQQLRQYYQLPDDAILFGDCGAFSYVEEEEPPITVSEAAFLYHIYGFDLGASVDHIPAPYLPLPERQRRLQLTLANAAAFLAEARHYGSFHPVGVVHGLDAADYARSTALLIEMGYRHLGIGGLVFRSDREIAEIVRAVAAVRASMRRRIWIHLFGIFRPKLQHLFEESRVDSFDTASYYRKAWLRSDQNYLGVDGRWYSAIRVPVSSDPRNRRKLLQRGIRPEDAVELEQQALRALVAYAAGEQDVESTLDAVLAYDSLIDRDDLARRDLRSLYRRTLLARPWEQCPCVVCRSLGIHVVIFRGGERNRRRGIHNTRLLYRQVRNGDQCFPADHE